MTGLSHIRVNGYKSIERLDLQLRAINVLIGPNGAGKSNFISFFRMLNDVAEGRFQLYVQRSGRAASLLYYGPRITKSIEAGLYFARNGYLFKLSPTEDDRLIFEEEQTYFKGDYKPANYSVIGKGNEESRLSQAYELDKRYSPPGVPSYVYPSVQSWRVYHFHDTSPNAPIKQEHDLYDNERLRSDAANLAAYLYLLREKYPANYALIQATVRRVFPRFGDFALRPNPFSPERIRLEWREQGSDYLFGPHQTSDGTLRFMALATLLLQPRLPTTVLIDEPELGLHPSALAVLAGLVKSAASRSQVILTTQSVTFLNQFEPEDVVVVERAAEGEASDPSAGTDRVPSTFRRIESSAELDAWLEDYSVGSLWEMNVLGGRP